MRKSKKANWGMMNVACLVFVIGIVFVVLKEGKQQFQPYIQAEAQEKAEKLAEKDIILDRYIKKLEKHYEDYQKVKAVTDLDVQKIRIMETFLLQNGGAGGKLVGRANDFMNVCKFSEINLDPLLLWAISLQETGFGHSDAIKYQSNVGGVFNGSSLRTYRSVYRGIVDMAINIRYSGYYTEVTGLFDNNTTVTTIQEMGAIYCPEGALNDPTGLNGYWVPNVVNYYNRMVKMYKEVL